MSDLVSSTKMVEELGDAAAAALWQRHDRLARDLLPVYEGREIDKTDGFLLLFERPLSAVLYALAYHDALRRLSAEQSREVEARVGIHLGEVVLHENPPADVALGAKPLEVEGLAKPTAARLMSLARGRQTLLTRGAFDVARRGAVGIDSGEGLAWLAHGGYLLKGVAEPVEIFEVGRQGHAPLSAPEDAPKARRAVDQRTVLGWRPAPALAIPHRAHWLLERKLGEGGFGEAWLAVHAKTRDRRVFKFCHDAKSLRSLKHEITVFRLLKEELGDREDIARIIDWSFEEPPYFLEGEYSAGGSLVDFAEAHGRLDRVPLETRLEITAQVATALQAAHSVGVLHKDVKPSNILITTEGGDGPEPDRVRARLTDFGIGYVTQPERLVEAGITALGMTEPTVILSGSGAAGTRLYMAPEVLEGQRATVQADVYALGVLLYQMVVGDFSRALAPGWRRDVDDELLRDDIAAAVDGSREQRLASARELAQRLQSLDDRRRRLVAERQQQEEAERLRCTLERSHRRRRRMGLAIALLALFAGALAVMAYLIAHEADRANREAERANREAERASREAGAARQVSDFMVELFERADPFGTSDPASPRGAEMTVREVLDRGVERVGSDLGEQPEVQARLLHTIGGVYLSLGLIDAAQPLIERALAKQRESLGSEHADVAESLSSLARLLRTRGELAAAESHYRQALDMRRRLFGEQHPQVASSLQDLAVVLQDGGEYATAEAHYRQALEMRQRLLGERHPSVIESIAGLASLLQARGDYEAAEPLYRQALEVYSQLLGERHPRVTEILNNLAWLLKARGDYAAAEPLYRQALEINLEVLGESHPEVAANLNNLAAVLVTRGDHAAAEPLFRQALEMYRQLFGDPHPQVAIGLNNLAWLFDARGDPEAAEPLFRQALEMNRRLFGASHPQVATSLNNLAGVLEAQGDLEGAETLCREALAMRRQLFGEEHPHVASSLATLASVHLARGAHDEAEELARQSFDVYRESLPPGHWRTAHAQGLLGGALSGLGRYPEAESLLLESYPAVRDRTGAASGPTRDVLAQLVSLYERWGKQSEAARYQLP